MRLTLRTVLAACALLAAACAQQTPPEQQTASVAEAAPAATTPNQTSDEDTCNKAAFAHLVGALASEIDQAALPDGTRIITPTTMVTRDFIATRLNIMTGTDGRVGSLSCY